MLGDDRGCCELKIFDPSVLVNFVGKKLQKFFITRVFYLVVHDMLNGSYCYEPEASKEQIQHYRNTMFKWESIEKPLKAVGSYTSDELVELSKQLGLEVMKNGESKKKTKNELYEQIVLNL